MPTQLEVLYAVDDLSQFAHGNIERRYGPEGQTPLEYHNLPHTLNVESAVGAIARLAVLKRRFNLLHFSDLKVAASFHDETQLHGSRMNEVMSAKSMIDAVEHLGLQEVFTEDHLGRSVRYLLATIVEFHDGKMYQSAGDDYGEMILADADLSALGAPFGAHWLQVQKLFREFKGDGRSTYEQIKFLREVQLPLLEHHRFYTEEAATLYPDQAQNYEQVERAIDLMKTDHAVTRNLLYTPFDQVKGLFLPSTND